MRSALLLIWFFLSGCDSSPPLDPFSRTIVDSTGTNQLALVYAPVESSHEGIGYAFHSLILRKWALGTNWSDTLAISAADFRAAGPRLVSVTDIESLDRVTGCAVIRVAEDSAPVTNGMTITVTRTYSWREWSMVSNREVRLLRVCKEPFEPYNPSMAYRLKEHYINRR